MIRQTVPRMYLDGDGLAQDETSPLSLPRHVTDDGGNGGYVLGESFTDPEIAELTVSESENLVYIRKAGGVGFDGLQSLEDLRNNWNRLIDVAG